MITYNIISISKKLNNKFLLLHKIILAIYLIKYIHINHNIKLQKIPMHQMSIIYDSSSFFLVYMSWPCQAMLYQWYQAHSIFLY